MDQSRLWEYERNMMANSLFFFSSNLRRLMHNFKFTRSLSGLKAGISNSPKRHSWPGTKEMKYSWPSCAAQLCLCTLLHVDHMTITWYVVTVHFNDVINILDIDMTYTVCTYVHVQYIQGVLYIAATQDERSIPSLATGRVCTCIASPSVDKIVKIYYRGELFEGLAGHLLHTKREILCATNLF